MRLRRLFGFVVGLMLSAAAPISAHTEEMAFKLVPPREPSYLFGTAWDIYADGEIDEGAPARLQSLLDRNHIPAGSTVYLTSPGGSVVGGLEFGRVLRRYGLYTYVGTPGTGGRGAPGNCFSACALAFLGGVYRWTVAGSLYGVHRFYSSQGAVDGDVAQVVSSVIVDYLREMGASPELFSEMASASGSDINVLSPERMRELHVLNEGAGPTTWSLESLSGSVYLKGERETFRGVNKFILICAPDKELVLYAVFGTDGRDAELREMGAVSLLIDGDPMPIESDLVRAPEIQNGMMNAFFKTTPTLIAKIRGADRVGVAFQFTREAPTFLGFDGLEIRPAKEKLGGLLQLCR